MIVRHLYVHIPFCARICPYCAFYKTLPDARMADAFCSALLRELDGLTSEFSIEPETIYFGGGTPTALSGRQSAKLTAGIAERVSLSELREWSIEANPGSVSAKKGEVLRNAGVTRISLGVQSWDNRLLRLLGREHTAAQAEEAFRELRALQFPSVSIDLMFGLPKQTLADWCESLQRTIALEPEHISTYCLTYEEDTEFFLRHARGEFRADESADAEYFTTAFDLLEAAGFHHYETSNYARPGHRSLHNQAYWRGADYLGIGPSAVSTVGLRRWQNVADYRAYTTQVLAGASPQRDYEQLTEREKQTERIALSLRTADGVAAELVAINPAARDEFASLGLWHNVGTNFVLTREGKLLADTIAEAFV